MKRTWKKGIAMALALSLMFGTAATTSGMTLFYANGGRDGIYVFVEAKSSPGVKTPYTKYGLKKGKYVSKVRIRLREGTFNQSKSTTTSKKIRIQKVNNPKETAYTTWKWIYK